MGSVQHALYHEICQTSYIYLYRARSHCGQGVCACPWNVRSLESHPKAILRKVDIGFDVVVGLQV